MSISVAGTFKSLVRNRLQAVLTLCGISVGVAMVVIVSGLGLGAHRKIESQLQSAGPTLITIRSGNFTPLGAVTTGEEDSSGGEVGQGSLAGNGVDPADPNGVSAIRAKHVVRKTRYRTPATLLGDADLRMLRNGIRDLRGVAAMMDGNVSLVMDSRTLSHVVHVYGFQADWPDMRGWKLASGRWISATEHTAGAPLAMLTSTAAARLWPTNPTPIGETLRFADRALTVVGIIKLQQGADASAVVPAIYVPLARARLLLGRQDYSLISVRAASVEVTTRVAQEIRDKLRVLHHLPDDTVNDFRVETESVAALPSMGVNPEMVRSVHSNVFNLDEKSYEQMARSLRQAGRTFSLLLAGGAAVSLLVGGIGVMNIMLVSVTARTREIGLRIAVGARMRDVLLQFLAEAIALASLGGLLGVVLGAIGLTSVKYSLHWSTAISPVMLGLALLMAAMTGVVFGYGPARHAAVLDPVIALRSE